MPTNAAPSARTYPRTCTRCRHKAVVAATVERTREVKYDGAMYTLNLRNVPAERCGECGNTTFGVESDDVMQRALREHVGLLQAEEILAAREELRLTQRQLADAIGCANESISRWEGGVVVQSRAYDRLMRAYFGVPEVREMFAQLASGVVVVPVVSHEAAVVPVAATKWTPAYSIAAGMLLISPARVAGLSGAAAGSIRDVATLAHPAANSEYAQAA